MKHLQLFLMVVTLAFVNVTITNAQGKSNEFIEEVNIVDLELDSDKQGIISALQNKDIYESTMTVRIGNIRSLTKRGALPVKIPGRKGALVAKMTNIEVEDDENFLWEGEFTKAEGNVLLIGKNGEIFGEIRINDETYKLTSIGKNLAVLSKIDNEAVADREVYPIADKLLVLPMKETMQGNLEIMLV